MHLSYLLSEGLWLDRLQALLDVCETLHDAIEIGQILLIKRHILLHITFGYDSSRLIGRQVQRFCGGRALFLELLCDSLISYSTHDRPE